ncbi:hypothetical protein A2U01_0046969 [Trifolium medium]|uniref:Uncharacterized protein n=1 Tax=Trifolium medium TaxID=97028 RepID=A0A392QNG7_9FABA|nr:hypothetical protein [Trifolium medium]
MVGCLVFEVETLDIGDYSISARSVAINLGSSRTFTLKETNFIKGRVKVSLSVTATGVDEVVYVVTCSGSFPVRLWRRWGGLRRIRCVIGT